MYIVLVDQSLWTSGTGSGEDVNPQDRNKSDLIQPKDGETPFDDDEEGGIKQIINCALVIEELYDKVFLKLSPRQQ